MRIPTTRSGFLAPIIFVAIWWGTAGLGMPTVWSVVLASLCIVVHGCIDREATAWGAPLAFVGAFVAVLAVVVEVILRQVPQGLDELGWFITVLATGAAFVVGLLACNAYLEKRRLARQRAREDGRPGV